MMWSLHNFIHMAHNWILFQILIELSLQSQLYIYIYMKNLESNWILTFRFLHPIIHLPQKLKNDMGHVVQNGISIKI